MVAATDLQQRVTDALPPRRPAPRGADHELRRGLHHQGRQQGPELRPRPTTCGSGSTASATRRSWPCCAARRTKVYIAGSDVKLNLLPLISQVLVVGGRAAAGRALRQASARRSSSPAPTRRPASRKWRTGRASRCPSDFGQITLLQSDALGPAQTAVKWFDRLAWILPLVTAALIALTIWLSRRRARTAIAIGIGAADRHLRHARDRQARVALPDRPAAGGQRRSHRQRTW